MPNNDFDNKFGHYENYLGKKRTDPAASGGQGH
ncbi:hypothetical protein CLV81_2684 [Flagellimonas meridianipacifica]|uniref:Uncharacterized protein n=1 Tax=Flagellimonas meridianipacifica TaxID=1080225 RepID=A0A2T0M9Z2_9FLAO|nr:hypothetical protein CLV81_2684 [Allomuricauda pacifica]